MASQGEREPGVVGLDEGFLESMVQDGDPEQDTPVQDINVQEQFFPQMDPEPEMGAAAAAEYDTSPSLLRNHPPILAESAQMSAPDIAQLFAMLAGMRGETQQMKQEMNNKMDGMSAKMKKRNGWHDTSNAG